MNLLSLDHPTYLRRLARELRTNMVNGFRIEANGHVTSLRYTNAGVTREARPTLRVTAPVEGSRPVFIGGHSLVTGEVRFLDWNDREIVAVRSKAGR